MKTTFSRLYGTVAAILLSALLLLGMFFQLLVKDYLETYTTDKLVNDARTISELAAACYEEEGNLFDPLFLINLTVATQVSQADAMIFDETGQVVMCSDSPLGCEHQHKYISKDYVSRVFDKQQVVDTGIIRGLYDEPRFLVSVPVTGTEGQPLGIVMVSSPLTDTTLVLQKISQIFLFVALTVVVVAALAMIIFVRRQSLPLRDLANAARDFGHGNLTARVRVSEGETQEIQELATAFNNMASSLQKSEYQRQEFVANVSHELKTPMTTIGGYVDGILDGTIPRERQEKYLQIVSDEVKRLSRLVRSMLDISRLQDQQQMPEEKKTQFDLEETAGQVLITFEQKILAKDLNVEVDWPEHPVFTRANQDAVTQVIYNLLDNAVKFCPQGGLLELRIREGGNKAYISIANQGETIPPEELPLVFDRFHKLDKSRSQNRDGWGLGLYIVKTLVCSHGENISVTSRDGKTEFTFTMPLVN